MNDLQIFSNSDFGEIRIITVDEEPMFCLVDVCRVLEIANVGNVKSRLNAKGIRIMDTPTNGGIQKLVFINEGNLYKTIFQSRKENAERFSDWVTEEVLPSIRKTGSYGVPKTTAGQIQLLAKGHMELEQKINSVNEDLQEFKSDIPLFGIECEQITNAKNKKVVPLMGGKKSNAYQNRSLRGKVYSDIDSQLRREFGVSSYKAIKRNQIDKALEIVRNYELPMCLKEEIESENAQMRLTDYESN